MERSISQWASVRSLSSTAEEAAACGRSSANLARARPRHQRQPARIPSWSSPHWFRWRWRSRSELRRSDRACHRTCLAQGGGRCCWSRPASSSISIVHRTPWLHSGVRRPLLDDRTRVRRRASPERRGVCGGACQSRPISCLRACWTLAATRRARRLGCRQRVALIDTLQLLWQGLVNALSLPHLAWAFAGVTIGTAVGVLPGIGPALTVAILLPVTFSLDPTSAFIMFCWHLLGRDVRRIDHQHPDQLAGRDGFDHHRRRRTHDGPEGTSVGRTGDCRDRIVRRGHARDRRA